MFLPRICLVIYFLLQSAYADTDYTNYRVKRSDTGVETCMQFFSVPKTSVVCDPPMEITLAIDSLTEHSERIIGRVDGLNQRLDDIDPTVPMNLTQEVTDKLNDFDALKQTQVNHVEILKRLESEINGTKRRLNLVEEDEREEVKMLIEQQSLLIKLTLEKANISLHGEYVDKLTESTTDLITKLTQLELNLKDKIHNDNSDMQTKLSQQDAKIQADLTEIRNNLKDSMDKLRNQLGGEISDRQIYYNLSLSHGGIVENLRTILTNVRENQAKSVTKEQELDAQVTQLQSDMTTEAQSMQEVTKKASDIQSALELVQQQVFTVRKELHDCRNETGELREDIDMVIEIMKRRAHLLPRTLKIHNCQDVLRFYFPSSGVYDINPDPSTRPFEVFCDLSEDEGWTVIQRRQDGTTDFFLGWEDYKHGFGDADKEYWLGLQHIHTMTSTNNYTLRVEVEDWSNKWFWAEYEQFYIGNEEDNYRLYVSGYSGNAGDSLFLHNEIPFSTYDRNNDNNDDGMCPNLSHGAWWYNSCYDSNLNGKYYQKGPYVTNTNWGNGVVWKTVHKTNYYSMKSSIMKIKPINAHV